MIILGIETSCDETALSLLQADGDLNAPHFTVLGTSLFSQVKIHEQYGGVFPMLAKREHAKNLVPLLSNLLHTAVSGTVIQLSEELRLEISTLLEREPELRDAFFPFIETAPRPNVDMIAVTQGPGLEPALWVGINFARALSLAWNIPIMPINHMEGHIVSPLLTKTTAELPAVALLISGGHTELVLIETWGKYTVIGETVDDAVGEAFDKVARMLDLPYPGGPQISKLAEEERANPSSEPLFSLPRPMLHSNDFKFSFSGLKTAVLYTIKKRETLNAQEKQQLAKEFEDAVTEVLVAKTRKALEYYGAKTLIVGGGVIANIHIRSSLEQLKKVDRELVLLFPTFDLATDNAAMIAMAAYFNHLTDKKPVNGHKKLKALGNLSIASKSLN